MGTEGEEREGKKGGEDKKKEEQRVRRVVCGVVCESAVFHV